MAAAIPFVTIEQAIASLSKIDVRKKKAAIRAHLSTCPTFFVRGLKSCIFLRPAFARRR